jgi:predicted PhzF superfamily epimerase YddE/YHI9
MINDRQRQALTELYQGEVLGEAAFDAIMPHLEDDRQRYVVATMLQLETETKARLRPIAALYGLEVTEDPAQRAAGAGLGAELARATWLEKMQVLSDITGGTYLPRYQEFAALAGPEDAEITGYMVEHEASLFEVAKRELAGHTANSVELVLPQLRYPLPVPSAPGIAVKC